MARPKSVAEFQAEKAAADAERASNGALTAADQEIVDAGGTVEYGASQEEDAPPEKKEPAPLQDLGDVGISEKPEAINVLGVLMVVTEAAGMTNVNGKVRFHAPLDPEIVAKVSEVVGIMPFTARYAGKEFGNGVTVKQQRQYADADGDRWNDIDMVVPETERLKLKNLIGLARSRGFLSLEPLQTSMNL